MRLKNCDAILAGLAKDYSIRDYDIVGASFYGIGNGKAGCDMLDKENIGKRIAFFRKEKGITQKELADLLHISYQAVSKWE